MLQYAMLVYDYVHCDWALVFICQNYWS